MNSYRNRNRLVKIGAFFGMIIVLAFLFNIMRYNNDRFVINTDLSKNQVATSKYGYIIDADPSKRILITCDGQPCSLGIMNQNTKGTAAASVIVFGKFDILTMKQLTHNKFYILFIKGQNIKSIPMKGPVASIEWLNSQEIVVEEMRKQVVIRNPFD